MYSFRCNIGRVAFCAVKSTFVNIVELLPLWCKANARLCKITSKSNKLFGRVNNFGAKSPRNCGTEREREREMEQRCTIGQTGKGQQMPLA